MLRKIWEHTPAILSRVFILGITVMSILAIRNYSVACKLFLHENTLITGNGYIPTDLLLEIADVESEKPLLAMDLKMVATRLSGYPFIKCEKISRIFPSTIRIDIVERTPFVRVKCSDVFAIIDRDGNILPADPIVDRSFVLPTITGETEKATLADFSSVENRPWIHCRTQLLFSIENQLPDLITASRLIEFDGDQITFQHPSGNTRIRLDMTDCEYQTDKLVSFYHTIEKLRHLTDYKIIDLRTPGQVIVVENTNGRISS